MSVEADTKPEPQVSNDEYEDLIERISELEEELGNLKRDIENGDYCYIYGCDDSNDCDGE